MARVPIGTSPWGAALNADITSVEAKADAALSDLGTRLSAAELAETIRDVLGATLVQGSNVTIAVNDAANTVTISASNTTDQEVVRDTIATALVAGTNITITPNDAGDTITIASTAGAGSTDPEVVRDTMAAALVAGSNVTITPNDAADTITIAAASSTAFALSGNLDGDVQVGDVVSGGIVFPVATTVDKIMINLDQEPRGSNMIIQAIRRVRATGTDTLLGTLTITDTTSRRATLSSLNTTFAIDDRLILRVTQVGASNPGAGISFTVLGIGSSLPAALAAPSPVSGQSAVKSGSDVVVSWSSPASGVYLGVDIFRDGAFYRRVLKGTNTFTDISAAASDHDYEIRAWNLDAVSTAVTASYTVATSTIGNPVEIASGYVGGPAGFSALTITVATAAAAGTNVVAMVGGSVPSGAAWNWVVTDSRGNTWTTHVHAYDNTLTQQVAIASCRVTTPLQVGDTITFTNSAGTTTARLLGGAWSISGLLSSAIDKTSSALSSTSNKNLNTGATAALAQTKEIAVVGFVALSTTQPYTPGSGWSTMPSVVSSVGTNDRTLMPMFQIVSATTALTGTGTLTTSGYHCGAIATFKGA